MPSQKVEKEQKMLKLVKTAGKMHKVCIYDVENKPSILKIYIDRVPPVDLKTCEKFMKTLLFLLESEGMNNRECEVSTPGLERPLKKEGHFQSAVGQTIRVTTRQPMIRQDKKSGKSKFNQVVTGSLYKYQDQTLFLKDGGSQWIIPLNMITKAHIVFESQPKRQKEKKL